MLRDEITARAGLGGMLGVNELHQHTNQLGFVDDKPPKLVESPRPVSTPFGFPNRCPLADALQVLKGYQAVGVFSLRHEPFADVVIGVPSKTGFPARQFSKMSFSRFSSLLLERGLEPVSSLPYLVNLLPRVELPIAVNGEVDNTEVYSDNASRVIRSRLWGIHDHRQVEGIISQDKVSLPDDSIYPRLLVSAYPDGDNLPPFESKDRYFIKPLEGQDAVVINHSRVGLKLNQSGLVSAVDFNHFAHAPYRRLSRKPVMLTQVAIDKVMQLHTGSCVSLKGKIRDIVAGFVKTLHSIKQGLVLLWRRGKFYHQGLLHIIDYSSLLDICQERGYTPIPPTSEEMGFLGGFL